MTTLLVDKKNTAAVSLLEPIKIYEIANKAVLQGIEDAEKVATTIVSRAIKAQAKGITLFAIDFARWMRSIEVWRRVFVWLSRAL